MTNNRPSPALAAEAAQILAPAVLAYRKAVAEAAVPVTDVADSAPTGSPRRVGAALSASLVPGSSPVRPPGGPGAFPTP